MRYENKIKEKKVRKKYFLLIKEYEQLSLGIY